jgi:hypothetical protein
MNVGQMIAEREQLRAKLGEFDSIKERISLLNRLIRLYDPDGTADEAAGTTWEVCPVCDFKARGKIGLKSHMKKHERAAERTDHND